MFCSILNTLHQFTLSRKIQDLSSYLTDIQIQANMVDFLYLSFFIDIFTLRLLDCCNTLSSEVVATIVLNTLRSLQLYYLTSHDISHVNISEIVSTLRLYLSFLSFGKAFRHHFMVSRRNYRLISPVKAKALAFFLY